MLQRRSRNRIKIFTRRRSRIKIKDFNSTGTMPNDYSAFEKSGVYIFDFTPPPGGGGGKI
jgi:hypothetical protein